MQCPDCGHDNIQGVDLCDACGQSLVGSQRYALPNSDFEERVAMQELSALAPKKPVALADSTTAREAIGTMVEGGFGCVLVERDRRMVGIFTERDVLNRVADDPDALDQPLSALATSAPECVTDSDTIGFALQAMDSGGYRHLPVVDNEGAAVGIVSVRDVLEFVHQRFEDHLESPS